MENKRFSFRGTMAQLKFFFADPPISQSTFRFPFGRVTFAEHGRLLFFMLKLNHVEATSC